MQKKTIEIIRHYQRLPLCYSDDCIEKHYKNSLYAACIELDLAMAPIKAELIRVVDCIARKIRRVL